MSNKAAASNVVQYPFPIDYYTDREVSVYTLDKAVVGRHLLPGDVFNVPVRVDILHTLVDWQRAKKQQGTHKVKDRSEVRGGGRKPWQQKGSGRARAGSIRAPHWRGGGVIHGPKPRSHAYKLNKKLRRLGLKCALSAKLNEGRLFVVDSLLPGQPKTRVMLAHLQALLAGQPRRSVLLMDSATNGTDGGAVLRRASGNLQGVEIVPVAGANVYSILRRDVLVMTRQAVDQVVERLRRPINRLGLAGLARMQQQQQHQEQEQRKVVAEMGVGQ